MMIDVLNVSMSNDAIETDMKLSENENETNENEKEKKIR